MEACKIGRKYGDFNNKFAKFPNFFVQNKHLNHPHTAFFHVRNTKFAAKLADVSGKKHIQTYIIQLT